MITADTITIEQIELLREEAGLRGETHLVTATFKAVAIGRSDMFWQPVAPAENRAAREQCARAINRRTGAL